MTSRIKGTGPLPKLDGIFPAAAKLRHYLHTPGTQPAPPLLLRRLFRRRSRPLLLPGAELLRLLLLLLRTALLHRRRRPHQRMRLHRRRRLILRRTVARLIPWCWLPRASLRLVLIFRRRSSLLLIDSR